MENYKCSKCKIEKPKLDFYKDSRNKNGINRICACCIIAKKQHKKPINNIEKIDGELWKDVVGYEGLYMVSNIGRIRSLDRKINYRGRKNKICYGVLLKTADNKGYKCVKLYSSDNIGITKGVHTIVANAFIPNPHNKPEVNHKNGIKDDNRVDNLEWVTKSENVSHRWSMTPIKPYNPRGIDISVVVEMYKKRNEGQGIKELSNSFLMTENKIRKLLYLYEKNLKAIQKNVIGRKSLS